MQGVWVSARMGEHAFSSWGSRGQGLLNRVFTLQHLPPQVLAEASREGRAGQSSASHKIAAGLSLRHLIVQAQALLDLKEPTPVKVHNLGKGEEARVLRINSASYGNHVRRGEAFFRLLAPQAEGGGASAESVVLECAVVGEPLGRLSRVRLERFDAEAALRGIRSESLRAAVKHISSSPVESLIRYWQEDYAADGPAGGAPRHSRSTRAQTGKQVRVRLFMADNDDRDALTSLPVQTICSLVRALRVDSSDWPVEVFRADRVIDAGRTREAKTDEQHSFSEASTTVAAPPPFPAVFDSALHTCGSGGGGLRAMFNLLHRQHITTCAPLSAAEDEEIASHIELNDRQLAATRNAFGHTVSCILGPPGTGKTRTIAAIADVAISLKRRLLVMAPANAASRRLLESLVSAGVDDVCLIVAQVRASDYIFEQQHLHERPECTTLHHTPSAGVHVRVARRRVP
jgi:hypothetical protein